MKEISAIEPTRDIQGVNRVKNGQNKNKGGGFEELLIESLKKVNNLTLDANHAVQQLALGNKESIHETMIAVEKASVSFQMMMEIRNKIIDAYKELEKSL